MLNINNNNYKRNVDRKTLNSSKIASFSDNELVDRILIGCVKYVYLEEKNVTLVRKKLPQKHLAGIAVRELLDESDHLRPNDVRKKFSKLDLNIDYSTVSRTLSKLVNVGYSEKSGVNSLKKPGKSKADNLDVHLTGPKDVYKKTGYYLALEQVIHKEIPRWKIYTSLRMSYTLDKFLTFGSYAWLLARKYTDVEEYLKVAKIKGIIDLHEFYEQWKQYQEWLQPIKDEDLLMIASEMAKQELIVRDWKTDLLYDEFFVNGGLSYPIIDK